MREGVETETPNVKSPTLQRRTLYKHYQSCLSKFEHRRTASYPSGRALSGQVLKFPFLFVFSCTCEKQRLQIQLIAYWS